MSGEDYQRKKRISVKPAYFVVSQLMRLTQTLLSILSQFRFLPGVDGEGSLLNWRPGGATLMLTKVHRVVGR